MAAEPPPARVATRVPHFLVAGAPQARVRRGTAGDDVLLAKVHVSGKAYGKSQAPPRSPTPQTPAAFRGPPPAADGFDSDSEEALAVEIESSVPAFLQDTFSEPTSFGPSSASSRYRTHARKGPF
jgi:hypothetical protein